MTKAEGTKAHSSREYMRVYLRNYRLRKGLTKRKNFSTINMLEAEVAHLQKALEGALHGK